MLKEGDTALAEEAVAVFEKMAQRVNDAKQAMENSARIISCTFSGVVMRGGWCGRGANAMNEPLQRWTYRPT